MNLYMSKEQAKAANPGGKLPRLASERHEGTNMGDGMGLQRMFVDAMVPQ